MILKQTYILDIIPGGVPVVVHCHQNDIQARAFALQMVSRNGEITIPTGAKAYIEGQKPDGRAFSYLATLNGTVVTIDLREQMTVLPGDVTCQCKVVSGGQVLISANFILRVEQDYTVDADTSSTEIPGLVQQAQAAAAAAESAARTAAEDIDDEWFIYGANNTDLANLDTSSKRVVGALNEIRALARGTGLIRGEAQEADINDITSPGWYYINPEITTQNLPINESGLLEVYRGTQTTYILQRYTLTDNRLSYARIFGAGAWTTWKSYDLLGFMWKYTLETNTDLNGITETGRYYLADVRTYTNAPSEMVWGQLEVIKAGNVGPVLQRITGAGSAGYAVIRTWERQTLNDGGNTWGDWKEVMLGVASEVETIPDQIASGLRMRCRKTGATVWIHVFGNASSDIPVEVVLGTLPEHWIPGTGANNVEFNQMVAQPYSLSASEKTPAIFGMLSISANPNYNLGQVKLTWLRTTAADGTWKDGTIRRGVAVRANATFVAEQ